MRYLTSILLLPLLVLAVCGWSATGDLGLQAPPLPPTERLLATSATSVVAPADTSLDTLATITIPANTIKANGLLHVTTLWSCTNNANNKTVHITLGSTDVSNASMVSTGGYCKDILIWAPTTTSQCWNNSTVVSSYALAGSGTGAEDWTTQLSLAIKIQKATSTDTVTLMAYSVWYCNP